MSFITREQLAVSVTATGGASQAFYSAVHNGHLEAVRYRRGTPTTTASGISTAAKIVLTGAETGLPLLTIATASADAMNFYPRAGAQDTSGGALGYTSAATPPSIPQLIPLGNERIKIEVTSGGAASNGGLRGVFDLFFSGN
jgi:hypothetical protein